MLFFSEPKYKNHFEIKIGKPWKVLQLVQGFRESSHKKTTFTPYVFIYIHRKQSSEQYKPHLQKQMVKIFFH